MKKYEILMNEENTIEFGSLYLLTSLATCFGVNMLLSP